MSEGQSVLIVEDEGRWQAILSELLQDEGYAVTVVADYQEARRALDARGFDLVILDLQLDQAAPLLDGERLLDHLARFRPQTPCIVVSGQGDVRVVRDAFKCYRVVDFIAKERFDIKVFVRTVQSALQRGPLEAVPAGGTTTVALPALRHALEERFDLEEIKNLCFDLQIDFDDLPGEGKKAREVVAYCRRHDRLEELVASVSRLRPGAV